MELVIALLVAGGLLLLAETVLPGMIAGIIGLICICGGVIAAYQRFGVPTGHYVLLGALVVLMVGTAIWMKLLPGSRIARVFMSPHTVGNLDVERSDLLHQTGTALSALRPSGTALINGRRVDVISEGDMIERGATVKVIAVEGLRVVVRAT